MQADDLDLDTQAEKLEDHADHPTKPEVKEQLVNAIALQPVLHDTSNKCDNIQSIVIGKHHKSPKSEGPTSPAIVFEKDASDKWVLPETTNSPIGTGPSESSTASPSPLSKISDNSADKVAKAEVLSNLSAISSSNMSPRKSVPDQSPLSGKSSSPSRKGFETEDSSPKKSDQDDLKRYSQVDDLKRRGRAFFQGIVENFTTQSTNRTAIGDSEEQSVQRETMIKEDRASWKQLLLNWQSKTDIPSQKKLRAMCWRGIPSSCRGEAWFTIIGNDLKITKDLYKILLSRTTSSSADAISKEDSANLIEVDAPRTFPELQFFHGDGPMRAPLVNILKTYVSFRPDVGYIQGMSYIAAMLLLNLDDECKAFISLANLLNRELYFTLFRDFQSGRAHLNVFDKLLQKHVPRCAQKFKELQLTSDMYLYDWILTIFSRSFPLDIACRIWDCFLVYGQVFMFRAALGVLKMYERAFLQSNFEQCLHLLNRIPRNMDENLLFQNIYSISISDKSLNAMLSKVQTLS